MPLRKPKDIPKIPKTRKKKAHTALDAIPSKKPDKQEFICSIYFKYDNKLKKQYVAFLIETVVEFTAFAYEVSVDVIKEKDVINLVIMGLKAKMDSVPQIMPAQSENLFEDLFGNYTINVVKQDGAINSANIDINSVSKTITVLEKYLPKKKNNRLFCEFIVDENKFTFPEK
ncbi:MAG: hypothetical protein N2321_02325 [Melioribacteraceae bacterium]|nr:hypothetical protein [Melioribacteraceae bacterium]